MGVGGTDRQGVSFLKSNISRVLGYKEYGRGIFQFFKWGRGDALVFDFFFLNNYFL